MYSYYLSDDACRSDRRNNCRNGKMLDMVVRTNGPCSGQVKNVNEPAGREKLRN